MLEVSRSPHTWMAPLNSVSVSVSSCFSGRFAQDCFLLGSKKAFGAAMFPAGAAAAISFVIGCVAAGLANSPETPVIPQPVASGVDVGAEEEVDAEEEVETQDAEASVFEAAKKDESEEQEGGSNYKKREAAPWQNAKATAAPPKEKWRWDPTSESWVLAAEGQGGSSGSGRERASAGDSWAPPAHIDLRWCNACGEWSYLRKKACVNSDCVAWLQNIVFCV